MELETRSGNLDLSTAFRMIATGYFFGFGSLFAFMFILMLPFMIVVGGIGATTDGVAVSNFWEPILGVVGMLIMIPIVLFFQAIMIGAIIVLGLAIYRRRRPITVVEVRAKGL